MSIATMKRRRRQQANGNRHLAALRRPGVPKKISESKSAQRENRKLMKLKNMQARKKK